MLKSRPARYGDVLSVALRLRDADRAELRAASGLTPIEALELSYSLTENPHVGVDDDDKPICIGGVVPHGERGAIWLLATPDVERLRIPFLRASRGWVERLQRTYPLLTNAVDERNTVHIEWLKWLGFTFIRRHPEFGVERRPFLEFVRIDPCVTPSA